MSSNAGYTPDQYGSGKSYSSDPGLSVGQSDDRSLGDLFSDVSKDLTLLLRQEVELAKAEAKQSVARASRGAGMLGGAGYAGHLMVLFLSVAAWWAIGDGTGRGWSALIVAVFWAIVAAVLAVMGRAQLKAVQGLQRTTETVKEIPDAVKGNEEAVR